MSTETEAKTEEAKPKERDNRTWQYIVVGSHGNYEDLEVGALIWDIPGDDVRTWNFMNMDTGEHSGGFRGSRTGRTRCGYCEKVSEWGGEDCEECVPKKPDEKPETRWFSTFGRSDFEEGQFFEDGFETKEALVKVLEDEEVEGPVTLVECCQVRDRWKQFYLPSFDLDDVKYYALEEMGVVDREEWYMEYLELASDHIIEKLNEMVRVHVEQAGGLNALCEVSREQWPPKKKEGEAK